MLTPAQIELTEGFAEAVSKLPASARMISSEEEGKKARGRPTLYTEDIAAEVCRRLANGETLRGMCRDRHMPDERTVRDWAAEDRDGFSPRYARARELQAHAIAERGYHDAMIAEDAGLGRLALDAAKWFAGKMLPKVYGDRLDLNVKTENPNSMTDEELAAIAARGRGTAAAPEDGAA